MKFGTLSGRLMAGLRPDPVLADGLERLRRAMICLTELGEAARGRTRRRPALLRRRRRPLPCSHRGQARPAPDPLWRAGGVENEESIPSCATSLNIPHSACRLRCYLTRLTSFSIIICSASYAFIRRLERFIMSIRMCSVILIVKWASSMPR